MSEKQVSDFTRKNENGEFLKIGIWDIETTGLKADYGYVLCVSVMDARTKKIQTIRIDDYKNPDKRCDKWLIKEAVKLLDQYDLLVGWYTTRFDRTFIDTRAAKYKLKFMDRNFFRDLWFTSRSRLNLRSNRLAVVAQFLFGKTIKNAITPDIWNGAMRGEKKSLDYVVKHCELDLRETLRVYLRFMPLFPKRLRKN